MAWRSRSSRAAAARRRSARRMENSAIPPHPRRQSARFAAARGAPAARDRRARGQGSRPFQADDQHRGESPSPPRAIRSRPSCTPTRGHRLLGRQALQQRSSCSRRSARPRPDGNRHDAATATASWAARAAIHRQQQPPPRRRARSGLARAAQGRRSHRATRPGPRRRSTSRARPRPPRARAGRARPARRRAARRAHRRRKQPERVGQAGRPAYLPEAAEEARRSAMSPPRRRTRALIGAERRDRAGGERAGEGRDRQRELVDVDAISTRRRASRSRRRCSRSRSTGRSRPPAREASSCRSGSAPPGRGSGRCSRP